MKTENKVNLKAIKPSGTNFGYCINCYNGCEHGCHYCYGMKVTQKPYSKWKEPQMRPQLLDWLKKDVEVLNQQPDVKADIKDIMLCSITDCYQPLELRYGVTKEVIEILIENDLPFTVLTKSKNVTRDIDLFKGYDRCRVGLTIMTLDDSLRQSSEPNASPIPDRIQTLKKLKEAGIFTYCSVEPIMTDKRSDPIEIMEKLHDYVDLFEFGKLNPINNDNPDFNKEYYIDMFKKINEYCEKHKINYCHAGHSEDFLKGHGLKFIPSPMVLSIMHNRGTDDGRKESIR